MKLPVEVSLRILGFLGHQALGRVMMANRQLNAIVNRHRKTLNLPEVNPKRISVHILVTF